MEKAPVMHYQVEYPQKHPDWAVLHTDVPVTKNLFKLEKTDSNQKDAFSFFNNLRKQRGVLEYRLFEDNVYKIAIHKFPDGDWDIIVSSLLMLIYMEFYSKEAPDADIHLKEIGDTKFTPFEEEIENRDVFYRIASERQEKNEDGEHSQHREGMNEWYQIVEEWFNRGRARGATHMLVVDDRNKEDFCPIYIEQNEDSLHMYLEYERAEATKVWEVYFLYLDNFDEQFFEQYYAPNDDEEDYDDDNEEEN